jgi:ribosomal protein L4
MIVSAFNKTAFRKNGLAAELALESLGTKEAAEAVRRLGVAPDELKAKIKELTKDGKGRTRAAGKDGGAYAHARF